jgi:hypothetical protein
VRALAVLGQRDIDAAHGDRGLRDTVAVGEGERKLEALDADLIDRQLAFIPPRLEVGNGHQSAGLFGTVHGRSVAGRTWWKLMPPA